MYYGSGTVVRIASRQQGGRCVCTVHSPGGSTFQREMKPWLPPLKRDVISKIRLRQSVPI